ncbi:hypothetical protein [uncultured Jatrophihabitans sp.]|uniref:hypothetical protein n=1 Tax=uncultured Jatrophihabitans sp. TaxID=1610747 RepID=UPI0035CAC645
MTQAEDPVDAPAEDHTAPTPRPGPSGVNLIGLLLTGVAAVLLLLAVTSLDWLSSGGLTTEGKSDSTFRGLRSLLRLAEASGQAYPRFVAHQYFTWGAWVLLAVVVASAALGNVLGASGRDGRPFGLIALVVGVAGVALTFVAIDLIGGKGGVQVPAYSDYIDHVGAAFFCAVAGFLVAAFAGAAAARRPLARAAPAQPDDAAS